MDLHVFQSASVLLVVLLGASLASGKECTNGFLNSLSVDNYNSGSLLPLLGQYGSSIAEQWIFPSLQFTCTGRLTKWIFKAADAQAQCRINIGTWRLDRDSFRTVYRRLSTTQGARFTRNGPIFTYKFASPVEVQPDDIVGVELDPFTKACPIFGTFDNILTLDTRGTQPDSISQSYRRFGTGSMFFVTQNPFTHLVPFLQPILEPATSEEPTIRSVLFTATTAAENNMISTTGTDPSTSSEVEVRTTTRNNPLSTTTEGSSALVNTSEPRDKIIFIIHIAAGVGIGTIALLGIVVACIGLVGIMKCKQARSAKGRQSDTEQPQVVISSSNGTLLQENSAYRKLMNSWSTDTTGSGYETLSTKEGRNFDTKLPQNTSNSNDNDNMVGSETTSTEEQSKPDSTYTQPQDSSNSSGIVIQENTAYKKSIKSEEVVAYETTSTVENRDTDVNQCANSTGIIVLKNTAYKKSMNSGDAEMGYETMDEIVEQVMQLNQAYGFQGEPQEDMESGDAGNYEMMTGDSAYDFRNQIHREVDKNSTLAETAIYDVLIQHQHMNPEDSEHSYDYVV